MARRLDTDHLTPLRDDIVALLRSEGASDEMAMRMASGIINALRHRYGGDRIYVAKDRSVLASQVRSEFTGSNHEQLCAKFRISRSTLWRYLQPEAK